MADTSHPPILVVDDNPDNAHIIRDYLEAQGYPITVAYNGDDALKAFEQVKPALVLLDVMMPGRDGWQVCRDIKQHPTLGRNVRVVMVTALDDWVNKRQALQTGADDFVEKLATLNVERPELRIAAPHLYPFGGFDKLLDWLKPKLAG